MIDLELKSYDDGDANVENKQSYRRKFWKILFKMHFKQTSSLPFSNTTFLAQVME